MDLLDSVLPVFVDYLGRFESEPGYVETSADIARDLPYMIDTEYCGYK